MDTMKKKLPIGIEDFEKLRDEDFYYIDKTGMVCELLNNWCEVNLFTRPRRFGKSLNMSMLKCFFEVDGKKEIFDGLRVSLSWDPVGNPGIPGELDRFLKPGNRGWIQ